jgi:hypothetical protein
MQSAHPFYTRLALLSLLLLFVHHFPFVAGSQPEAKGRETWKAEPSTEKLFRTSHADPPKTSEAATEYIAKRLAQLQITLKFHKQEIFVGEPLYYSVAVRGQEKERDEFGFTLHRGSFEYRDALGIKRYPVRNNYGLGMQESWGMIFAASIPKPSLALTPPYGSSDEERALAVRRLQDFLGKPGTYQVRAWLASVNDSLEISSPAVEIKVREPTAAERTSLKHLVKFPNALQAPGTGFNTFGDELFADVEEYASDPNVPLREELQLMLADVISEQLSKQRVPLEVHLARAQQELTYRLHVSPDKHWLRWLAFGRGGHIAYRTFSEHPNPKLNFDWDRLDQSYRESSPLLPQLPKAERDEFQLRIDWLTKWCELQRALKALDAANE